MKNAFKLQSSAFRLGPIVGALVALPLLMAAGSGQAPKPAAAPAAPAPASAFRPTLHIVDDSFYVAGLEIPSSRNAVAGPGGELVQLWQQFFEREIAQNMPNRVGSSMMVVYSHYAKDGSGKFDYLIGVPVSSIQNLPAGTAYEQVPAGAYDVFQTPSGPLQDILPDAWMRISAMTPVDLGGKRTYAIDYESLPDPSVLNPQDASAEIHVGITPQNQ